MTVSIQYLEEIIHETSDAGIVNVFVASIKLHQEWNLSQGLVPTKHGVHSSSSVRIQTLSSRHKIEDCETKAEQLCLWRSFEAFTDFKLPFFARFGLEVLKSRPKFPQFLPSKPLFDSRNASHQ